MMIPERTDHLPIVLHFFSKNEIFVELFSELLFGLPLIQLFFLYLFNSMHNYSDKTPDASFRLIHGQFQYESGDVSSDSSCANR